MNLESANLILRTSSVSTTSGDKNTDRTNITWRNINMRAVLGTLYNKYKRYKICLTSIGNVNVATIANVADRVLNVNMKGFNWVNQTYDTSNKTNTDTVILSTAFFNSANGFSINYTGEIGCVFQIPVSENVDINIFLNRVSDGTIPTGINYNESVFCFSIYGVVDE
jgi:hypothetical protein